MLHFNELAKQQGELDTRLKKLEPEPQSRVVLPRYMAITILFTLAVAGTGLIWFLFVLVNYKPNHKFDVISVISTVLTLIGLLYLAYDLLGHENGLLRSFTLFVTGGLAGVIIYEPLTLYIALEGNVQVPLALQITLSGGLLGGISAILIGIPDHSVKRQFFSLKSCLIGAAIGFPFSFLFFSLFTLHYPFRFLLLTVLIGVPVGGILGGLQKFISYVPSISQQARPSFISWKNSLIGFAIGSCFWGLLLLLVYLFDPGANPNTLLGNIIVVVILALASAAAGGIARFTFWWVNNLPERALGVFGLTLAVIGAVLPLAQPLFNLLQQ